jgi:hypothetical protein
MDPLQLELTLVDIAVGIVTAIVTLTVSSYISYNIAKRYGDLAGSKAAIEFEKEKAEQARITTLKSLLNEVIRIRDLAYYNYSLKQDGKRIQSVVKMPIAAFETAFLSGESSLPIKGTVGFDGSPVSSETPGLHLISEPLASVTSYLTKAYAINALVDIYLGLVRGLSSEEESRRAEVISQIVDESHDLLTVLPRLEKYLERQLEGKDQYILSDMIEDSDLSR